MRSLISKNLCKPSSSALRTLASGVRDIVEAERARVEAAKAEARAAEAEALEQRIVGNYILMEALSAIDLREQLKTTQNRLEQVETAYNNSIQWNARTAEATIEVLERQKKLLRLREAEAAAAEARAVAAEARADKIDQILSTTQRIETNQQKHEEESARRHNTMVACIAANVNTNDQLFDNETSNLYICVPDAADAMRTESSMNRDRKKASTEIDVSVLTLENKLRRKLNGKTSKHRKKNLHGGPSPAFYQLHIMADVMYEIIKDNYTREMDAADKKGDFDWRGKGMSLSDCIARLRPKCVKVDELL